MRKKPLPSTFGRTSVSVRRDNQAKIKTNGVSSVAFHATVPYLLEKKTPSTWTLPVGGDGDRASRAAAAMSQGAMYSFAARATRDLADTNIRFNEVYLSMRVLFDEVAEKVGVSKVSDFSKSYEQLLQRPDIKGARILVRSPEELKELKYETKEMPPILG